MKLALRTAQFGLNYGISNTQGQTSLTEINQILATAWSNNIHVIDTAHLYGESEKILGESQCQQMEFKISTKTIKVKSSTITKHDADDLERVFHQSLKHLKKEKIYSLLIHDVNDMAKPGSHFIIDKLKSFQANGLIQKIGISIYTRSQIEMSLARFTPDIIQLPINVFDQRLLANDFLNILKKQNIELFARSIFLQGLLLMDTDKIPPQFSAMQQHILNYHRQVKKIGLSLLESALIFVKNIQEIDHIIIGVNSNNQLNDILLANAKELSCDWQKQFMATDERLINPMLWK